MDELPSINNLTQAQNTSYSVMVRVANCYTRDLNIILSLICQILINSILSNYSGIIKNSKDMCSELHSLKA